MQNQLKESPNELTDDDNIRSFNANTQAKEHVSALLSRTDVSLREKQRIAKTWFDFVWHQDYLNFAAAHGAEVDQMVRIAEDGSQVRRTFYATMRLHGIEVEARQ